MTATVLIPFICWFSLNSSPSSGFYAHKADVVYENVCNLPYLETDLHEVPCYTIIDYRFDMTLNFTDSTSYRLDIDKLTVSWQNKTMSGGVESVVDDFQFVHNFNDVSYTYDYINNFQPSLTFGNDEDYYYLIVQYYNGGVLQFQENYESHYEIWVDSFYNINFDMSYFTQSLNSFLNSNDSYSNQWQNGYDNGYYNGQIDGANTGYGVGYTEGFNAASQTNQTAITIFNGILNIGLVPINFFLAIFNFEILGINVSQFMSALLSICLIIIVVRFVTGKKQGGE